MDKIAIISDVHGNYTALTAVLENIKSKNISLIYCLGDSLIKCANPDLVIDLLRENCQVILKGNCDEVISKPNIEKGRFWSRDKIGEERASFLYSLPVSYEFYLSGHLVRLFHSSPFGLDYVFNPLYDNKDNFYANKQLENPLQLFENTEFIGKTETDPIPDVVGYGHLHTPNLFRYQNKTIFNTGSVGIPIEMMNTDFLDKTNLFSTLASYVILEGNLDSQDLAEISFTFVRVPYDIEKEVESLRNSTLSNREAIITNLRTATNF